MHADPSMSEELAAHFYPRFEARWRRVEIVGRVVMLVAIAATFAGLLGGGPVHIWTRTATSGDLSVEYQPVARYATPSGLVLTIRVPEGAKETAVTLSDEIAGRFGLQAITPQPLRWEAAAGTIRLVFAVVAGERTVAVRVGGMPTASGPLVLSARQDGAPPLAWRQFILP